jgi:para-nitrobenzyl esterase
VSKSNSNASARIIGRRTLIKTATGLASGTLVSSLIPHATSAQQTTAPSDLSRTIIRASSSIANVETIAGKIRGYIRNDIYTFKGVPYGANTAGELRFLAPSKPTPWTGVRTTMQYGCVCPQQKRESWKLDELAFLMDWDDGHPGEDCLVLNIWTPSLSDGRKRPVMVWLHGGAYIVGSGHELKCYDGENLSRRGDVVVITFNHRLGILGYLNLSGLGDDRFTDSVNVAMLDIVRALEWVRDNIASFGGDPGNVTVFGQSAGGAEISALMAMPGAQGLFHRAIVQSGSINAQGTRDHAVQLRDAVLKELGLTSSNIRPIQNLPVERIIAVGTAVASRTGIRWRPWVDGRILPSNPFYPAAPSMSANVPMLIGTVMNETSPIGAPNSELLYEDVEKRARTMYGDKGQSIIEMARRLHPQAKLVELSTLLDADFAINALLQARRKSALRAAPAYMYLFAWHTPVLDGRPLAFHQSELPFVFDNADRCAPITGGGSEPRALAAKVSDAWINFARSGNSNHQGLPDWPAFTTENGATMVFDSVCQLQSYPDRPLHDLITSAVLDRKH